MDANAQAPTLDERVAQGVSDAFLQHGYSVTIGEEVIEYKTAAEDRVYEVVSAAVVEKRADRGKIAITKRGLMSFTFGQIAGPEAWEEQEDPEWAKGVYSKLEGYLWRLVAFDAGGKIQERLNGDTGLILCRTKATPDKADAVYVTTDLQCLLADFSSPQKERLSKEAKRFATNLAMAVERQPEYANRFKKELTGGMKTALGSGQAILTPAIEAATGAEANDDGE